MRLGFSGARFHGSGYACAYNGLTGWELLAVPEVHYARPKVVRPWTWINPGNQRLRLDVGLAKLRNAVF